LVTVFFELAAFYEMVGGDDVHVEMAG